MNIQKAVLFSLFFMVSASSVSASQQKQNLVYLKTASKVEKAIRDDLEKQLHTIEACVPYLTANAQTPDEELERISEDFTTIPEAKIYWYHNTRGLCLRHMAQQYNRHTSQNQRTVLQNMVGYTFYNSCYADSPEKMEIQTRIHKEMNMLIDILEPEKKQ